MSVYCCSVIFVSLSLQLLFIYLFLCQFTVVQLSLSFCSCCLFTSLQLLLPLSSLFNHLLTCSLSLIMLMFLDSLFLPCTYTLTAYTALFFDIYLIVHSNYYYLKQNKNFLLSFLFLPPSLPLFIVLMACSPTHSVLFCLCFWIHFSFPLYLCIESLYRFLI